MIAPLGTTSSGAWTPRRRKCGRSRTTRQRSGLAGWAEYGYCAAHSRYFWGIRLHLIATPAGLPIAFAAAGAEADEREVCSAILDRDRLARPGRIIVSDKGYRSAEFEEHLNNLGMTHIRPAAKNEKTRPRRRLLTQPNHQTEGERRMFALAR